MKANFLLPVLLLISAASIINCSKKDSTAYTPPASTDLKIVVSGPGGGRVANAGVWLYTSQSDWTNGQNSVKYATTDANGQASFEKLSSMRYWFSVKTGCMNNNNMDHVTSAALPSGQTTTATTTLEESGTLRFVNNSSNPYRIYINGVVVADQNGNTTLTYMLEPAGAKTIRVVQLSGYLTTATDKTYTGTLSCGGTLTTTYP